MKEMHRIRYEEKVQSFHSLYKYAILLKTPRVQQQEALKPCPLGILLRFHYKGVID